MRDVRLYKRAAARPTVNRPLWFVGQGVSTFAGPLTRNDQHAHSVPVLLTGLAGPFRFKAKGADRWSTLQSAVVPAGVAYEFDMAGDPLSVIYLEPSAAGIDALARLVRDGRDAGGIFVGRCDITRDLRALFEDQASATWAEAALQDFICSARRLANSAGDGRIRHALCALQAAEGDDGTLAATAVAASVGLSSSRFQHLFTSEVGVPFRRYRAWRRMLLAIRAIGRGESCTAAAHAAGYVDQSHFGRDFRRMFGASPARGLANVRG